MASSGRPAWIHPRTPGIRKGIFVKLGIMQPLFLPVPRVFQSHQAHGPVHPVRYGPVHPAWMDRAEPRAEAGRGLAVPGRPAGEETPDDPDPCDPDQGWGGLAGADRPAIGALQEKVALLRRCDRSRPQGPGDRDDQHCRPQPEHPEGGVRATSDSRPISVCSGRWDCRSRRSHHPGEWALHISKALGADEYWESHRGRRDLRPGPSSSAKGSPCVFSSTASRRTASAGPSSRMGYQLSML